MAGGVLTKELVFLDKCGQAVKPGALIVYGKALGRCAGLQYGKALYVTPGKRSYYMDEKEVVPPVLRFIGADASWSHRPVELQQPSSLHFSERVLLVRRDQVDGNALELLDTVRIEDYQPKEKKVKGG